MKQRTDKPLSLLPFITRAKISNTLTGKRHSDVAKRNMSRAQKAAHARKRNRVEPKLF